jgi:hypothetical protein
MIRFRKNGTTFPKAFATRTNSGAILVPDRRRKKFKETLGRFGSDAGNDRWNLECFAFVKNQRVL